MVSWKWASLFSFGLLFLALTSSLAGAFLGFMYSTFILLSLMMVMLFFRLNMKLIWLGVGQVIL